MKQINVNLTLIVEDAEADDLKSCINHHLDRLCDFDNWPEIRDYQSKIISIQDVNHNIIL